jgi:hypothetical protein
MQVIAKPTFLVCGPSLPRNALGVTGPTAGEKPTYHYNRGTLESDHFLFADNPS